jgi:hypothetical protein
MLTIMAASIAGAILLLPDEFADELADVDDVFAGSGGGNEVVIGSSVVVTGSVLVAFQPPPVQLGQHPT